MFGHLVSWFLKRLFLLLLLLGGFSFKLKNTQKSLSLFPLFFSFFSFRFIGHHPLTFLPKFETTENQAEKIEIIKEFAEKPDEIQIPGELKDFQARFFKKCLTKDPKKRGKLQELMNEDFLCKDHGTMTTLFDEHKSALPWIHLQHCVGIVKKVKKEFPTLKTCKIELPKPIFVREMAMIGVEFIEEEKATVIKEVGEFLMKHLEGGEFDKQIESIEILENQTRSKEMTSIILPALSKSSQLPPTIVPWNKPAATYYRGGEDLVNSESDPHQWIEARQRVFEKWREIVRTSSTSEKINKQFPGASIVPVVCGSNASFIHQSAALGFKNIAFRDSGFFGKVCKKKQTLTTLTHFTF